MKNLFLFLVVGLNAHAGPLDNLQLQKSPFEACRDIPLISRSDYRANQAFWDQAISQCAELNVQVMPQGNFLQTLSNRLATQEDNLKLTEFLNRVGSRALARIQLNAKFAEVTSQCAKVLGAGEAGPGRAWNAPTNTNATGAAARAWFAQKLAAATTAEERAFYDVENCDDVVSELRDQIEEVMPKARVERALIRGNAGFLGRIGNAVKDYLNTDLLLDPAALSAAEQAQLAAVKAAETQQLEQVWNTAISNNLHRLPDGGRSGACNGPTGGTTRNPHPDGWFCGWYINGGRSAMYGTGPNAVHNEALEARAKATYFPRVTAVKSDELTAQHVENYANLVQSVPLVGYLRTTTPSNQELAAAADKVLANARAELAKVQGFMGPRRAPMPGGSAGPNRVQSLLQYGPIVREILAEDKSFCQTATGVTAMVAEQKTAGNIAMMIGMVGTVGAAAIVGPAAMAAAGSVPTLTASTFMATSAAGVWSSAMKISAFNNFAQANQRAFSVVETQNNGRAVADMTDVTAAADEATMQIALLPFDFFGMGIVGGRAARFVASARLRAAMAAKGKSPAEIENLITRLSSSDAAIVRAAVDEMARAGLVDPSKLRLIRLAISKGFLRERNPEAVQALVSRIRTAPVAANAVKILEGLNSAVINEGNREHAWNAAIAAAEFGIVDPTRIANLITDWAGKVEGPAAMTGLTSTLVAAQAKLALPEIARIANVADRQAAAMRAALNDMRQANPELKALPDTEWQRMADDMTACPIGPRVPGAASLGRGAVL